MQRRPDAESHRDPGNLADFVSYLSHHPLCRDTTSVDAWLRFLNARQNVFARLLTCGHSSDPKVVQKGQEVSGLFI